MITVASDIGLIFGGAAATLRRVREASVPGRKGAAGNGTGPRPERTASTPI